VLQTFLSDLLGSRYSFGSFDAPYFDLFLWFVLSHRPDMAMIWWEWCKRPMLTAIVGSYLLRQLAKHHTVKNATVAEDMRRSAARFEQLAISVCLQAFEDDRYEALAALEQPVPLFPGSKLIDLAYTAGCLDFISVCGRPSINRRMAGDLLDVDMPFELPGGLSFVLSPDAAVLAALSPVGGFGLLAPFLLSFRAPPKHPNFRYSTQRRRIPDGYPYDPHRNSTMSAMLDAANGGRAGGRGRGIKGTPSKTPSQTHALEEGPRSAKTERARRRMTAAYTSGGGRGASQAGVGSFLQAFNSAGWWSRGGQTTIDKANQLMQKLQNQRHSDDEQLLAEFWRPTFGYWERLRCFYRAPITLYWLSVVYRLALVGISCVALILLQTKMFAATHVDGTRSDKYHLSNSTVLPGGELNSPLIRDELSVLSTSDLCQWCLSGHYALQLFLVLVSVLIQPQAKRWLKLFLDVAGSLCFLSAALLKYHTSRLDEFYQAVAGQVASRFWSQEEEPQFALEHREGWVFFLQGLSAFLLVLCFIHELSALEGFGTFVLTYFNSESFSTVISAVSLACV